VVARGYGHIKRRHSDDPAEIKEFIARSRAKAAGQVRSFKSISPRTDRPRYPAIARGSASSCDLATAARDGMQWNLLLGDRRWTHANERSHGKDDISSAGKIVGKASGTERG